MRYTLFTLAAAALTTAIPLNERASCSCSTKLAALNAELKTIASHSATDAAEIPLAPLASRTFFVTPNEVNPVTVEVNVGVTAGTVRTELVALATALNAGVEDPDVYCNANGTATSDFIQTDRIALPYVHVREIHTFNEACQITTIVGYVHGPLTSVTGGIIDAEDVIKTGSVDKAGDVVKTGNLVDVGDIINLT